MTSTISATLVEVRRALADHADTALWSLSDDELAADLAEVAALRAQVAEFELRLVAQADRADLAASTGAATTARRGPRRRLRHLETAALCGVAARHQVAACGCCEAIADLLLPGRHRCWFLSAE